MQARISGAYIRECTINAQEVDFTKKATLTSIVSYVLDTAGAGADFNGIGIRVLHPIDLTWVLLRFCIEMKEYPNQYEKIYIETWVEDCGKLFTTRNFNIYNKDEQLIGQAYSVWSMLNMVSRKAVNILDTLTDTDKYTFAVEVDIDKPKKILRVNASKEGYHTIKYSDIDFNGHCNSGKYLMWLLDMYNKEQFETKQVQRLDISYSHEALFNETVSILIEENEDGDLFDLKTQNCSSICKARLVWINK